MADVDEKMLRRQALFQFLEPAGQCHAIEGSPKLYFPNTNSAKWILSLLLSSQDIGLALKLLDPFLFSKKTQNELLDQYRYSHSYYFWRLLCAHSYEAWLIFNKAQQDAVVRKIKKNDVIKQICQQINEKLSFKSGVDDKAPTVKDVLEKCRHVTFHYYEENGDSWSEYVNSLPQPIAIGIGDYEADCRWIVADKYLDSRLALVNLQDLALQENLRNVVLEILSLIRQSVKVYFDEIDSQVANASLNEDK